MSKPKLVSVGGVGNQLVVLDSTGQLWVYAEKHGDIKTDDAGFVYRGKEYEWQELKGPHDS